MSSITWTQDALKSNAQRAEGRCWRVVELQSDISTMKITDTLEEQAAVEKLIEETKSQIPDDCKHLNYLLFTPFRYAPYLHDSRFRRSGSRDGVFYASEHPETAVAEMVFHRLLFYAESPNTPWPANPGEYTAFTAEFIAPNTVDLMIPPLVSDRDLWTHPTVYTACLEFADVARAAGLEAIIYESVRDPKSRRNIALVTCLTFAKRDIVDQLTWHFHFGASGVRATCRFPDVTLAFDRDTFAADPRFTDYKWDRP
jgi:RES domain-containing protein